MKYTWLVEKYLEGELSGEALQKFELEILRKPEAARELERIRSLQKFMESQHAIMSARGNLIEDFDDIENVMSEYEMAEELEELKIRKVGSSGRNLQDFRTKLAEVEANRTLHSQRSRMILVRKASVWIAAASLVLLIITSSLLLFGGNRGLDYQAVYNQFYSPAPHDISSRTASSIDEDLYNTAMRFYIQEKYAEALDIFDQIPEPTDIPAYYLYKGITVMELGRHQEAISLFSHLKSEALLNQFGMWYTGLCYLALEDAGKARNTFQDIIAREGHYIKDSKRILRKI